MPPPVNRHLSRPGRLFRSAVKSHGRQAWLVGLLLVLVAVLVYFLPPVHSRLAWRLEELQARWKIFWKPPESAVFLPTQQQQLDRMVTQTLQALTPTATFTSTQTPLPHATATITPTPLPERVALPVPRYFSQCNRWNYCGPANLAMALAFWGWKGDRDDVARAIKPGENDPSKSFIDRGRTDLNVMPYEMVDFVNEQTEYRALFRHGGEIALLKTLIANGFPVVIEKGYYQRDSSGRVSWMGHYAFVTGYDEAQGGFLWQDAYPNHCQNSDDPRRLEKEGRDNLSLYSDFLSGWRGFNYVFLIVYPPEREAEVLNLLGPWADASWAARHALQIAEREMQDMTDIDLFFAWFNKGTSHVQLLEYADAAAAYDYAFQLYATLPDETRRPYRMLWYQTGPYWAYYYTGRYQDVITLADVTLDSVAYGPTLEESIYWKAMAQYALGQFGEACANMRRTVYLNQHFAAGLQMLQAWGCP